MTDHAQRVHARRAITCLYLQVPESIAKSVEEIVESAFAEDDKRITQAHAAGRREGLEEAAVLYREWVDGKWFDAMEFGDALRAKAKEGA